MLPLAEDVPLLTTIKIQSLLLTDATCSAPSYTRTTQVGQIVHSIGSHYLHNDLNFCDAPLMELI